MNLDFLTLYIVILLNSFLMCWVWLGFVLTHRDIPGARLWLAAGCCIMLGGIFLVGDGPKWGKVFFTIGTVLATMGFCCMWNGMRVFYGRRPLWGLSAGIVALGPLLMLVVGMDRPTQNVINAVSQMIPMGLAMVLLLRQRTWSMGGITAILAILISMSGQMVEAALNALRILGVLSTPDYFRVAAYLLVTIICGGTLWNLAFLLMAIDRLSKRLMRLARRDELTRLSNRRAFRLQAEREIAIAQADGGSLTLFVLDLDRFKDINDNMGHAAGDACLRHFARVSEDVVTRHLGSDVGLARMGGDEFALIAAGLSVEKEQALARDLVRVMHEQPLEWRERSITLAVSIGIASWRGEGPLSLSLLQEKADAALYETKRHGRNGYALAANAALTGAQSSVT